MIVPGPLGGWCVLLGFVVVQSTGQEVPVLLGLLLGHAVERPEAEDLRSRQAMPTTSRSGKRPARVLESYAIVRVVERGDD